MSEFLKRYIIVVILLIFTASVVGLYKIRSQRSFPPVDIFKIPKEFSGWKGEDIPMDESVYQALQTKSVMMREYRNQKGESVVLTVVYYRGNRVELHLPERCSVGQGSDIAERGVENIQVKPGLNGISANRLIVESQDAKQVILYYFQSGSFITPSFLDLRLHMISNKLRGRPNSGALVKFSSVVDNNTQDTIKLMKDFIACISPFLDKYLM